LKRSTQRATCDNYGDVERSRLLELRDIDRNLLFFYIKGITRLSESLSLAGLIPRHVIATSAISDTKSIRI